MSEPVWQPDSSSSNCFLCDRQFTLFNRRHHCRKCGQVVCGWCSNQEIRYFASTMIVNPTGRTIASPYKIYRTCDSCVEEIRMIRRALFEEQEEDNNNNNSNNNGNGNGLEGANSSSDVGGAISSEEDSSHRVYHNNESTSSISKHMDTCTRTRLVKSSTQSSLNRIDDTISDHDLCPVCALNLHKVFKGKGIEEFESFKESHINECLTQYDFSMDHQRSPKVNGNRMHTRNKMLVYNIPPIPPPKYESIGKGSNAESETSTVDELEKNKKECIICLEILKPGDKVGRLECLCVFHYKCIKDWFNKKGYGECPVHFLQG